MPIRAGVIGTCGTTASADSSWRCAGPLTLPGSARPGRLPCCKRPSSVLQWGLTTVFFETEPSRARIIYSYRSGWHPEPFPLQPSFPCYRTPPMTGCDTGLAWTTLIDAPVIEAGMNLPTALHPRDDEVTGFNMPRMQPYDPDPSSLSRCRITPQTLGVIRPIKRQGNDVARRATKCIYRRQGQRGPSQEVELPVLQNRLTAFLS
ncbi:hypothetical protein F4677DRAFT_405895 [Hypoxylon crocopeplum]|nr:hypothetical protein F4677DRAFT_405895 [Hypoxylon crocopeplum]